METTTIETENNVLPLAKSKLFSGVIYNTITASLLPVRTYSEGKNSTEYAAWWYFRAMLFNLPLFEKQWSNEDFRQGVDILNDLVQATAGSYPTQIKQFNKFETARTFYGFSRDADSRIIRGVQSLISSLQLLRSNYEQLNIQLELHMEELDHMLICLRVIEMCQQLWSSAEEEKTEPTKD